MNIDQTINTLIFGKMYLPKIVNSKIERLLFNIFNIEWSGVLFYKQINSNIHIVDILPLDIGTTSTTSFEMDEDVIAYMTEHNLLDCKMGLCHSHHMMSSFFSHTDIATAMSEGQNKSFVSLIVNNAKEYSALITKKDENTKKVILYPLIVCIEEDELSFIIQKMKEKKKTSFNINNDILEEEIWFNEDKINKYE